MFEVKKLHDNLAISDLWIDTIENSQLPQKNFNMFLLHSFSLSAEIEFNSLFTIICAWNQFFQKGIKVTVVCPGPIETSNGTGTSTSEDKKSPEVG